MGYRIDIDHGGCITCGICMDVCPVEALDMSRPDDPGCRDGSGPGPSAGVDDGAAAPGGRVHRLRHLHQRVPAQRDVAGHDDRRRAARGAAGPDRAPVRGARRRVGPALAGHPRGAQARPRLALGRPVHLADALAAQGRGRSGRRWSTSRRRVPIAPCQGACPAGTDAGPVRGPDRRRSLRRGVRRRRRGQSLPVGVRLDLHGAVRGRPAGGACSTSRSRSGP